MQTTQFVREVKTAEFWEFATKVPRSRTVAERESRRLRGAWLTDDLAVQRIHGFGLLAVRIICVRASDDAHKQKLVDFFRRDERNLRARFLATGDPLDGEPRVLLKVPYDRSLDGWVEHEWEVLSDLQGIPGVPKLAGPAFFFEDLGVRALALEFTGMPSLQQHAESRRKPATEELFRMTIFFVGTLEKVHQRGWLHADLQPKDLLVLDKSAAWQPLRQTTESMMQEEPIGLICGWTHAMRWTADAAEMQRREVCAQLQELLGTEPRSAASAISMSGVVSVAESYSSDKQFRSRLASLPGPSAFSAPEQFVTLFTGQEMETPATDVYRLAAIATQTFTGEPFKMERTQELMTTLRRLSHRALLRRARERSCSLGCGEAPEELAQEVAIFTEAFRQLLKVKISVPPTQGLEPWLASCLARDPAERLSTASEALELLGQLWSETQAQLLKLRQEEPEAATTTDATEETEATESSSEVAVRLRRERLELESPELLKEMTIL